MPLIYYQHLKKKKKMSLSLNFKCHLFLTSHCKWQIMVCWCVFREGNRRNLLILKVSSQLLSVVKAVKCGFAGLWRKLKGVGYNTTDTSCYSCYMYSLQMCMMTRRCGYVFLRDQWSSCAIGNGRGLFSEETSTI